MTSNGLLVALGCVTLAGTLFVAVRVAEPPATSDVGERLSALEGRLDTLEGLVRETRDDARRAARTATTRRVDATAASGDGGAADPGGTPAAPDGAASAEIGSVVARHLERTVEAQMERMALEKRHRGADGKWKPPIADVVSVLELTDQQQSALSQIFDGARDELFTLLRTERTDGGTLLDDFVADLRKAEDPKQAWSAFLGGITTRMVPGSNRTYLSAIGDMETQVRDRVRSQLDEQQARRFGSLEVDVFDVKTGYDPVGTYVKDRLAESAE